MRDKISLYTINYVFANAKDCCVYGASFIALIIMLSYSYDLLPELVVSVYSILRFVISLASFTILGGIVGYLFFLVIIVKIAYKINGAPFHVGDTVHILVGPYRGREVRVYDVWPTRGQVRVELGEYEEKEIKDVFGWYEICSIK